MTAVAHTNTARHRMYLQGRVGIHEMQGEGVVNNISSHHLTQMIKINGELIKSMFGALEVVVGCLSGAYWKF